jgi:hypothetical protein|nr:MAG TPA: hypothetical protein [Caudoviricetes sp.]
MTNYRPIVKTSAEFKQTVIDMVRAMPLDDFLLIPQAELDKYISAWTEPDINGVVPANEEYKQYFQFIMTIPSDMQILDMDLYYFRIARKIIGNMMIALLESQYYNKVFGYEDINYENYQLLYELIQETGDKIEDNPDNRRAYMSAQELKQEFNKYYQKVLDDNTNSEG